jgi:hypothetical protein
MHKINIIGIIIAHLRTLRSGEAKKISKLDFFVMYIFPIFVGIAAYLTGWCISSSAIELSVTVYSIFAALLLSVQVALYGVSLRPLKPPADSKKQKEFNIVKEVRRSILSELNDNVSYLILLSIFFVTILLIIAINDNVGIAETALAVTMYLHFFVTLLMVVKRASIVFSREYEAET